MKKIPSTLLLISLLSLSGCSLLMLGTAATVTGAGYTGYKVYEGGEKLVSRAGDLKIPKKKQTKPARTIVFQMGTLKAIVPGPVKDVAVATEAALKKGNLHLYKKDLGTTSAGFKAVTTMSEKVAIDLMRLSEFKTEIKIRVGDGNMSQSQFIYEEITKSINLKRIKAYEVAP